LNGEGFPTLRSFLAAFQKPLIQPLFFLRAGSRSEQIAHNKQHITTSCEAIRFPAEEKTLRTSGYETNPVATREKALRTEGE